MRLRRECPPFLPFIQAWNEEQINRVIDLLMEEEIFASVDYTGYSQNQDGDWSVNVNCTMAPVQGEAEE